MNAEKLLKQKGINLNESVLQISREEALVGIIQKNILRKFKKPVRVKKSDCKYILNDKKLKEVLIVGE